MKITAFKLPKFAACGLAVALAMASAACGGQGEAQTAAPTSSPASAAPSDTHSGHGASGSSVEMRLVQFKPGELEVPAGTEVTWTQGDAGFHTVTSGTVEKGGGGVTARPDGKFRSERLATDGTFKFVFNEAGTYPYFCEIHPATMTGEVTVGA